MSGNRFFIREISMNMMAKLVNIMSEPDKNELQKMQRCLREVKLVARFLEKLHRERNRLSQAQLEEQNAARELVLMYALYYDRMSMVRAGDSPSGDCIREDLYMYGDYIDWKQADRKARQLFAEYVRLHRAELVGYRERERVEEMYN